VLPVISVRFSNGEIISAAPILCKEITLFAP
jgi:hypothetical protein